MIPVSNSLLSTSTSISSELPSYTYKIKNNRIVGFVDEKDAVIQAVNLILQTERFAHAIYSWDYGCEIQNLYALDPLLTIARLKGRIEEALFLDTRILSIEDFEVSQEKGKFYVSFTMNTIFGETDYEGEI